MRRGGVKCASEETDDGQMPLRDMISIPMDEKMIRNLARMVRKRDLTPIFIFLPRYYSPTPRGHLATTFSRLVDECVEMLHVLEDAEVERIVREMGDGVRRSINPE